MTTMTQEDHQKHVQAEIERAYVNADDDWKKNYYRNAAQFLARNRVFEGGKMCAYCRERGMPDPHHHNVWGAMLGGLRRLGWIEKVGRVAPTTKHTHIDSVCQWESKLYRG